MVLRLFPLLLSAAVWLFACGADPDDIDSDTGAHEASIDAAMESGHGANVASDTTDTVPAIDSGAVLLPQIRQNILIAEDSLWAEALRIHYNAIVVDGHIDTPTLMIDRGYVLRDRHLSREGHVDLPRMFEGGLDGAFFGLYVPVSLGESAAAARRARHMIADVKRQVAASPDSADMAYSAADVRRIARSGRKAVLLGLESGHALMASPDTLEAFYDAGVRYVTLTHVNSHSWAESSQSPVRFGGLNEQGRHMVRRMNDLGMIIDLSHASDSTFYDALAVTSAPVMLSHSSARALVDNVRNIDDDMLRAIADNRGIIMINFFDAVVNSNLSDSLMAAVYRRTGGRNASLNSIWDVVYQVKNERGLPGASLGDVVDHIDHAVRVAGIDHVGLGSDFDGVFDLPAGLQDVTRLPWITYELMKRGYSEDDLYKILGGNVLRVMDEVEAASRGGSSR